MKTLSTLQDAFQRHVLRGEPEFVDAVVSTETASAADRADIYFQAYRLRLLEALGKDYPALRTLLGEDAFDEMGHAYLDRHPSRHPSLRWFGKPLTTFLSDQPPYAARPALAELAAFEWAQGEAFDAEDMPLIGIDAMAEIAPEDWGEMRFLFQPSIRRLCLDWNVTAICKAAKQGEPLPEAQRGERPVDWLLWRRDRKVYWRSLGLDEADALTLAQAGENFSEVCEALCEHVGEDQAALRAAVLLKQWLNEGLLTAIDLA